MRILDEAVDAGVQLSHRYLAGRQLPDKAVSVLDTACARLSLGQNATPPAIEDAIRQIDDLEVQQRILEREAAVGADHRRTAGRNRQARSGSRGASCHAAERWEKERDLVVQIRDIRTNWKAVPTATATPQRRRRRQPPQLRIAAAATASVTAAKRRHRCSRSQRLQTDLNPAELARPACRAGNGTCSAARRSRPDSRLRRRADCRRSHLRLDRNSRRQDDEGRNRHRPCRCRIILGNRVIGQSHALDIISQRIQTSRATPRRSQQAGRRFHAGRTQRRRQDRDRARACPICSTAASTT